MDINIDNLVADLKVDYKDQSVLTTPSPELEKVNQFFSDITSNDKGVENLLFQILGNAMCKTAVMQKAFIFKGKGRNGKSRLFRILEAILGEQQCSYETLETLSGNKSGSKTNARFLKGCTVNISEDQQQPRYINHSILNKIISGDTISEIKGKERIVFRPYATMLFSVNDVIDFKETKICITDRIVVIPCNATFIENRNINIEYELCQPKALQIIATRAINAFKEVLKNGKFTIPPVVELETNRYFMDCNNVIEFCNLFPIKEFMVKDRYHKEYCKWCASNNLEAYNNVKFGKEVLNLGYRSERFTFGRKKITCYVSPNFNNTENKNIYHRYLKENGISEEAGRIYDEATLVATFGIPPFDEYLWKCNNNTENTK